MREILYKWLWSLCPGPLVGLLEHSGALQLLPQHEDPYLKEAASRGVKLRAPWVSQFWRLGLFLPHFNFLSLDESPHIA